MRLRIWSIAGDMQKTRPRNEILRRAKLQIPARSQRISESNIADIANTETIGGVHGGCLWSRPGLNPSVSLAILRDRPKLSLLI